MEGQALRPGVRPGSPLVALVAVTLAVGVCSAVFPSRVGAQTILNVERLQPGDVERWHWGVEGALSIAQGNSEYVEVVAGVVVGHRWTDDWIRVFTGVDHRSEAGEDLEDDRYLHVRYNRWFTDRWQSFHFIQLQSSEQNLLQNRLLLGSGLRRRIVGETTTLDLGTGVMWEREDLDAGRVTGDHPTESRVWRMANLMVATHPLTESVRLIGVGYLQPDLSDLEDLRTLTYVSLLIELTDNVDLAIRNEWRHDSRPPRGVKEDDYVLRTGFAVSFR